MAFETLNLTALRKPTPSFELLGTSTEPASPVTAPSTNFFEGLLNSIGSGFTQPTAPKSFSPVQAAETVTSSFARALDEAGQKIQTAYSTFNDHHTSLLQQGVNIGEAGLGALNTVFTAALSPLTYASSYPGIGIVADKLNQLFSAIGNGASFTATEGLVQNLPVSQETKDTIKPLVGDIASLVAQLSIGKLGEIGYRRLASKSQQVITKVKEDVVKTTEPAKPTPSFEPITTKARDIPSEPVLSPVQREELAQKPSKIGKSVEAKAIEQGLSSGFDTTATYDITTFKEQAAKAAEVINKGTEHINSIIAGDAPLPDGLHPAAFIAGVEEYIKKNPDIGMLQRLANSKLVTETSRQAQALSTARMREQDSATIKLAQIRKAREVKARYAPKRATALKTAAQSELRKVHLTPEDLGKIESFVDSIIC